MPVSQFQLHLLRAMYLLIAVGLTLTAWPSILFPVERTADSHAVVNSMLGAFSLLSLLGLRYPLQMIPILLFELIWKTLWVVLFALPVKMSVGLDEYASGVLFACLMGIVITPITIPWKYVFHHYVKAAGDPWRSVKNYGK
jgi:hypothetical protein